MKKYIWSVSVITALVLLTQSCSDSSVKSTDDVIEEKKEEILEKTKLFLPDNLLQAFESQIDSESSNINKLEYLDTLNVSIEAFIDSINKHSSLEEFKRLIQDSEAETNKILSNSSSVNKSMSCVNNFGLGFSKGGEVYGEVSIGVASGVVTQLNARGGGGIEFIYDFVNMDRGTYTYSFCGFGGANVALGGGVSASVGFTGVRKWLWNIKPNQLSIKDRFEGSSRARSFGLTSSFFKVVGLEASADVAYLQELGWESSQSGLFQNLLSCPTFFGTPPIRDGVKEISFSLSGGIGTGAEVIIALKGEAIGVYRTFVEQGYTDYGVNRWGRLVAGVRMGSELLGIDPVENIRTGGTAPVAAAVVTLLSLFNPSDCPPPIQLPYINNSEFLDVNETTATIRVNISDDGGDLVSNRGLCWSEESYPTRVDSCNSEGSGTGEFTSTISDLNPDTKYFARAYATNSIGTGYGEQLEFRTEPDISMPTVETRPITSVRASSAVSGGNITDDGGDSVTARGVCWSTSQNPDLNDSCTTNGNGTGEFTSNLTNLNPGTQYYVRAYATNEQGTGYGNERSFTTEEAEEETGRDNTTAVVEVTSATGRVWMDRNLGASRAATSMTDSQAYGDLYQWGRASDGHQKRNSPTTITLSNSDQPGHGSFILAPNSPYDWRIPQNNNLWQGVNGINNPCPVGFRIPTDAEWEAERQSWSSNNATGAFASPLKLPVSGNRNYGNGSLDYVGSYGMHWPGTVSSTNARRLRFDNSTANMRSGYRAGGLSVRCIKD